MKTVSSSCPVTHDNYVKSAPSPRGALVGLAPQTKYEDPESSSIGVFTFVQEGLDIQT